MSSPPAPSADPPRENENEVDVDAEMEDVAQDTTSGTAQDPTRSSSTLDHEPTQPGTSTDPTQTHTQSSLPPHSRKDVTLREFLSKMDDYAPIIPDAVTAHYLTLAGLPPPSAHDPSGATTNTTPLPLARLLALATQKFVADIAADAYQYSRIRAGNTTAAGTMGAALPGQMGVPGTGGAGGAGGGAGGAKGAQAAQLGVQRAGFGGGGQGGSGQGKTVLTMEDLGMAVQEYGINVKRGEFYR
ncbi:hypothetical protein H2198_004424 [Neophaeococcomyces mojaviensis]|uniref:Uncharacterized protein n=1 Tax=Neophaeococcomyces mojaviensis TaxID=3383035 RepID=A0ACC3A8N5_9EURO|nr:hypothetical protein H2198_004424 [Knufia sp. JES_112]